MKTILHIILLGILLAGVSRESMLDEEIRSQVPDDYFNTPEGFEAGIKACYETLRTHYGTERGMSLTVFGTDTYTMGEDGSWKFLNQYTAQLDHRTGLINETWNNMYVGINTCNAAITRATVVELDETVKNQRVAEARFLRAHYYFILVQMFGPVHLSTEETTEVTTEAARAPLAEVYDAIVQDLEFAIENLPESQDDYGRATRPASEHLLARVLLTRATSEAALPDDYQRAAALATGVIANYDFELLDDFAKVFEQGSGEINPEVIWSVQYTGEPLSNGSGNSAHLFFLMEYDTQPGMERDVENGRPFRRFRPTAFTLETLFADRENDARYEKSFKQVFYCNKPGTYNVNGKDVSMEAGDTAIWLPGYELPAAVKESKDFQVIEPDDYSPEKFPTLVKFLDPNRPDKTTEAGSRDFLAFRLAETYLIAAEALMMSGNSTEAVKYINTLRARAARE
ncbi:MAG TPA: RagB/SusD family nutrient uptake outer membrane protein, partial [Anseongella sp.]|nr:RagB/SusD family nutrient uptake outer membrane protein [Anseongella sp.]